MAELKFELVFEGMNKLKRDLESVMSGGGVKGSSKPSKEIQNISKNAAHTKKTSKTSSFVLGGILGLVAGLLRPAEAILGIIKVFFSLVNNFVSTLLPFIFAILKPVMLFMFVVLGKVLEFLKDPLKGLKNAGDAVGIDTDKVAEEIKKLADVAVNKAKDFGTMSENFASSLFNTSILDSVKGLWDGIKDLWAGLVEFFTGLFSGDVETVKKSLLNMLGGIGKIVGSIIEILVSGLLSLIVIVANMLATLAHALFELLFEGIAWVWEQIKVALSASWELLKTFGQWLWDGIVEILDTSLDVLKDIGQWIWDTITGFFSFSGGSGTTTSVNDAIITPRGDIVKTHPDDFIIATKNPQSLGGSSSNNITINISGNADKSTVDKLITQLRRELQLRGTF
jgi:phage-related protein